MRLLQARFRHFRRLGDVSLSFTDARGAPGSVTAIVGPNGCGKTSVLQAIAGAVGTATGRIRSVEDLEWPGFVPDRVDRHWPDPCQVDLTIAFTPAERTAVDTAAQAYQARFQHPSWQPPDTVDPTVELVLSQTGHGLRCAASSAGQYYRFRGRQYAQAVVQQLGADAFDHPGTVLWYTEQRETWSLDLNNVSDVSRTESLNRLRAALIQLENQHLRSADRSNTLYARLERAWQGVFPGRGFEGGETRDDQWRHRGDTPGFLLVDDAGRTYELAEMSGAERAVFPLLFDLVRWRVHESIVLIDELELHLHPPLQQALVTALPTIGRDNQYILTTHSQHVVDVLPADCVVRLDTP